MEKSTYKIKFQKVKGGWVNYLMFLGIALLFTHHKYIGLIFLIADIILTVIYKNNGENKSKVSFNYALRCAHEGKAKEAIELLKEAIEYNKLNKEAYFFLGCILFDEEDYTNALDYFKRGHADEISDPSLHYAMGRCYFHIENYERAIEYLEAISYEGNEKLEKERLFVLGKSYAELENYNKAYAILKTLNFSLDELKGDSLEYCYYIGVSAFFTERIDEAKDYLNRVNEVDKAYKNIDLYIKNL